MRRRSYGMPCKSINLVAKGVPFPLTSSKTYHLTPGLQPCAPTHEPQVLTYSQLHMSYPRKVLSWQGGIKG